MLTRFVERNLCLPERLIIYRDGVSEGEFERVRTLENKALRGK